MWFNDRINGTKRNLRDYLYFWFSALQYDRILDNFSDINFGQNLPIEVTSKNLKFSRLIWVSWPPMMLRMGRTDSTREAVYWVLRLFPSSSLVRWDNLDTGDRRSRFRSQLLKLNIFRSEGSLEVGLGQSLSHSVRFCKTKTLHSQNNPNLIS